VIYRVIIITLLIRKLRGLEERIRVLTYAPAGCRHCRRHVFTVETRRGSEVLTGTPAQGQDARPATLSPRPKLLSVLWDEWVNGIGGRLPAKDFSPRQRGKCKVSFSHRKIFWDCMQRLIDNGCTSETALQRISRIYRGTITQILAAMQRDERRGGHNELCPFHVNARQT